MPNHDPDRVVVIGQRNQRDLALFGDRLNRLYQAPDDGKFDELLAAIDLAEARARLGR